MTTALTVLAWLAAAWIALGILTGCYALYRFWKDWR